MDLCVCFEQVERWTSLDAQIVTFENNHDNVTVEENFKY